MIPDLGWLFKIDTSNEEELLDKPWWWLRHHILALFRIPDSLTGTLFHRSRPKD